MMEFHSKMRYFLAILVLLFVVGFTTDSQATEGEKEESFNVSKVILDHVKDDHVWHFWEGHSGTLFLPVIVYSDGLNIFSSSNFYDEHHHKKPYKGYRLADDNKIYLEESGKKVIDLSITKNVAMLFINAALLIGVFSVVARGYAKNTGRSPKGMQSFFEPIILFVRDEIVKPNIGHGHEKYLPYMLTLFFFILFGNILGLLPGAANLTGNIAVTMTLALLTFIITNFSGRKSYWSHVFWTPGVPHWLRIVILPVEVIGLFTKPFSLMIRLFVAVTAGHIVILGIMCLTFIFKSYGVGISAVLVSLFINMIELLVAGIQAYVFTMFSSLYIGMATAQDDHH